MWAANVAQIVSGGDRGAADEDKKEGEQQTGGICFNNEC